MTGPVTSSSSPTPIRTGRKATPMGKPRKGVVAKAAKMPTVKPKAKGK